ncbi:DUF3558 domain-containing protein [Nocardia lasii]|uniref:DUF3558 domain-containing protein n=1 Tax=Nocardia lasii TaxID=1616107 RepID=A0ABW1JMT7_9NOCA
MLLAGCGNDDPTPDDRSSTASESSSASTVGTSPARPTLTAPHLQPPVQDNKYIREGKRPKVVVDPCTWIEDGQIAEIGFEPASRRRARDLLAEYSFLTCRFMNGDDEALSIESGNVSLDEVREKYAGSTEELLINGREAIKARKSSGTCSVDLQTKVGYFGITVTTHTPGLVKNMQPCDDIVHIATVLEPAIGKEN